MGPSKDSISTSAKLLALSSMGWRTCSGWDNGGANLFLHPDGHIWPVDATQFSHQTKLPAELLHEEFPWLAPPLVVLSCETESA
jgi:hypothetical protein